VEEAAGCFVLRLTNGVDRLPTAKRTDTQGQHDDLEIKRTLSLGSETLGTLLQKLGWDERDTSGQRRRNEFESGGGGHSSDAKGRKIFFGRALPLFWL